MHNFQIKRVFKSNKKSQRFRDFKHRQNIRSSLHTFKRITYDKFDYKLFLLSWLTRELALYETRSQWDETHYEGESYFSKPYLNHSILDKKTHKISCNLHFKLIC